MSRKYNSTTNVKYNIYNPQILRLKSTSQRIITKNIPKEQNYKNNNNIKDQKNNEVFALENNLINYNQKEQSSILKQNIINEDSSLDNISNIISQKKNNLPNTKMLFEDNESSLNEKKIFTNSLQTKNKSNNKNLKSFSNINNLSNKNKNIEVYDSHTKSFQIKMQKMKEMNNAILKEKYNIKNNKTLNSSKKGGKDLDIDLLNNNHNSKSIINCKRKIYMKNKNKLLHKGNIFFNDIHYNNGSFNFILNNSDNEKKLEEEDKTIPFLCCFSKS